MSKHHRLGSPAYVAMGAMATLVIWGTLSAWADVTVKRTANTKGMAGILDAEIKSEECIQGEKSCTDTETRSTNKVMKFLAGSKPAKSSSIARLDKDVMWQVDHKGKTYTEMTFAEMRAMMDSLKGMMAGNEAKTEIDTSEVTFAPPTFEVKQTGVKETIAGYPCAQSILTMTVEGTNKKDGKKFQMVTTMDMMLTKDVPGAGEFEAFGKKMAEKMGLGMDQSGAQAMMSAMGAYGVDAKKLAEEAAKIEGFPMRQVVRFLGQGQQFASAEPAKEEAGDKDKDKESESAEEDNSSKSDLASKALGGLFGKKKDKKDKKAEDSGKPAEAPDNAIFKMTSEVTEISTSSVAASRFEIPEGYKLKPAGKK